METVIIKVAGMSCANCAMGIKRQLDKKGFNDVNVNFAASEVSFSANNRNRMSEAEDIITSLGYKVIKEEKKTESGFEFTILHKFIISLILTLPMWVGMFSDVHLLHQNWFHILLAVPVYLIGLQHFGVSAFKSLKTGIANMDVLIITGATAAFGYSLAGTLSALGSDYMFFETSSSIITVVLLGNLLEHYSVKKTTSAIDDLLRLQPVKARVIKMMDMKEYIVEKEISQVLKAEVILVNSGDKVPVDGVVVSGSATVDESMLTGESAPVLKKAGDGVVAGCIAIDGNIRIKCTATGNDTVLSQIIRLVKSAQEQKPALQSLADKISSVFVPVVVALSLITFIISYFFTDIPAGQALLRGIAVLVISCPCALGLAIPTAVVVGVGKLARKGIMVKGGITMDKFAHVKKIIFDKTGTLTTGAFRIRKIHTLGDDESYIKSILKGLEKYSSHPIARSISSELADAGIRELPMQKTEEIKGIGINGWDDNGNFYQAGAYTFAEGLTGDNSHDIYVLVNNRLAAYVDIEDEIKPETSATIAFFKRHGIVPVMLSGDKREKCMSVAAKAGIDEVYYEKKPSEKLDIIKQLSQKGMIAMTGDGINDAPALAMADVGISLSNATQIAVKSSQIILLNGNLSLLIPAYLYSRRTLLTIKQNLFWAFFYNVLAIPLAAAGYLSPLIAAFSMAASDVVVVLNSLRLKWYKQRLSSQ